LEEDDVEEESISEDDKKELLSGDIDSDDESWMNM